MGAKAILWVPWTLRTLHHRVSGLYVGIIGDLDKKEIENLALNADIVLDTFQ